MRYPAVKFLERYVLYNRLGGYRLEPALLLSFVQTKIERVACCLPPLDPTSLLGSFGKKSKDG
jgi:hypothetical protein